MYQSFIILLLFYFIGGAALTPAFANTTLRTDKNVVLSLLEDSSESRNNDFYELCKKLVNGDSRYELTSDDLSHIHFTLRVNQLLSVQQQPLQSKCLFCFPLYLLFHSLLFYELV